MTITGCQNVMTVTALGYDHSDTFAKVAPLPLDKMPIGTISVSAGNDNER